MINKRNNLSTVLISGLITFIIFIIMLAIGGHVPFGINKSLASMDANIQYIDLYAYLKDVILGKNNFSYTFSNVLGGSSFSIFSYYLSSPINLLVIFFSKDNLRTFFDIAVVIKLVLAALSCSYFLAETFKEKINSNLKYAMTIVLSVSYALCQYNIAQSSNIMWLDGVYMLPLMLLFIHKIVIGESKGWKLAIVVGYMIIANWYSAGINCIFSGFWFIFEYVRNYQKKDAAKDQLVNLLKNGLSYVFAMVLGIMLSTFLFIPTVKALQGSSRGDLKWDKLFDNTITGDIKTVLRNYVYGATSAENSVALFCGCIVVIGVFAFFLNKKIKVSEKVKCGLLLLFAILSMYWKPLISAFSMFQDVNGYWYRYSYLAIFVLIYIAGEYFLGSEYGMVPTSVSAILLSVMIVLLNHARHSQPVREVYATALMFLVTGFAFGLVIFIKSKNINIRFYQSSILLMAFLCIGDSVYNSVLLMDKYAEHDSYLRSKEAKEASKQISMIQSRDRGVYRITQTYAGINANYDEAFAHNYWSLAGYTSSPNDMQRGFLDKAGYNIMGPNFCVVNTSMLGIDSFLGTKYVLSSYPINGLKRVKGIGEYNGRKTYLNPYALPMAVQYKDNNVAYNLANHFEYQNSLYSKLIGKKVSVYQPLNFSLVQEGDIKQKKPMIYKVSLPKNGKYAVYGMIPWNTWVNAELNVDDKYKIPYSSWLSPVVFHMPTNGNKETANVSLAAKTSYDIKRDGVAFYALDLKEFAKITSKLKSREPKFMQIKNGDVKIRTTAKEKGESLYLSVPCDKGWTIKLNGKDVQTQMIGDCLYSIPLRKGNNNLSMHYRVPGFFKGLVVTLIGIILLGIWITVCKCFKAREIF